MTSRFDIETIGAPSEGIEHRHHRLRAAASLVAAIAGALAMLLVALVAIGGVGPDDGAWAWAAIPVLAVIWLTGLWWRWDSPDRRTKAAERERLGF